MADRYTGRHIRQARHAAWMGKKRSVLRPRQTRQLLPAAAALTVAGVLIGGAGAVIRLAPQTTDPGSTAFDQADYPPPDRNALADRAGRDQTRPTPQASQTTKPSDLTGGAKVISTGSCAASFYNEAQATANGETFNPDQLTAAHKSLPFNSQVRVINVANGKSVTVRINDRGPFVAGRCLDLSRAAFQAIASLGTGVVDVRYEVLAQDAT